MAMSIQSVSPTGVAATGGDLLTITGQFEQGVPLTVSVGGVPCQSGIAGQGTDIYSPDGVTLTAFSPSLAQGAPANLTVADEAGNTASLPASISLFASYYASEIFSLRSILPPAYNLGWRSFADLPEVNG